MCSALRPVSGVGGWRDSREDLGAAVGQLASREIQLHLQSVLVAEADELREPVDGHQVTSDWVINLRDIRRMSAETDVCSRDWQG